MGSWSWRGDKKFVKGATRWETTGVVYANCNDRPEDALFRAIEATSRHRGQIELHYCDSIIFVQPGESLATLLEKHYTAMQSRYNIALEEKHEKIRADYAAEEARKIAYLQARAVTQQRRRYASAAR